MFRVGIREVINANILEIIRAILKLVMKKDDGLNSNRNNKRNKAILRK